MNFLTIYKNIVIVLNTLVAVVSGNRIDLRSFLTRIYLLFTPSATFIEHQLCARHCVGCWDTVVSKTQSLPWGTLSLSFDEYAKLGLYSKKKRKFWEHLHCWSFGWGWALQPQGRSRRNQEAWKEMRMGILWRNRKTQHFIPPQQSCGGPALCKRIWASHLFHFGQAFLF